MKALHQVLMLLSQQLRKHGFAVDSTQKGIDGAFLGETEPYDVIILDLGLPDLSGLNILSQWRKKTYDYPRTYFNCTRGMA